MSCTRLSGCSLFAILSTLLAGSCGVPPRGEAPTATTGALSLVGVGAPAAPLVPVSPAGPLVAAGPAAVPAQGVARPGTSAGPLAGTARVLVKERHLILVDDGPSKDDLCRDQRRDGGAPLGVWEGTVVVPRIVSTDDRLSGKAYCRYTWRPRPEYEGSLSPIDGFVASGKLFQVDKPLVAMHAAGAGAGSGASTVIPSSVWTPLRDNFRKQAGYVTALPESPRAPVTVAVLDTATHPYDDPTPDNSPHGRAVGRVVDSLACPTPDRCPKIANYLALPEVTPGRGHDPAHGGFFGTRGQVAEALQTTLDEWAAIVPTDDQPRPRLIINMSFGWSQVRDGNQPIVDGRTLTADVVWQHLRRASCLGALLVAAAGNGGAPDQVGPLFPAAWETEAAPGVVECRQVLDADPDPDAPGFAAAYRPLVYAVGAVDYRDKPLAITRPGSIPRLVAHGLSIATEDLLRAPGYTGPLTGTSMAAAQLSGTAAAIWGYVPGLSPHDLVERIYKNGVDLTGLSVEHCLGAGCAAHVVRRLSLCQLRQKLPGSYRCAPVPEGAGLPAVIPSARAAAFVPARGASAVVLAVPPPALPTPIPSDEPGVLPQPVPTCSVCVYNQASGRITGYIPDPPPGFTIAHLAADGAPLVQGLDVSFDRPLAGGPYAPITAALLYETSSGLSYWGGYGTLDVVAY